MRPILMKGHERPLTFLKYNRDGVLLFSCAKDHDPTVWFADNGERLGTYRGHNGAWPDGMMILMDRFCCLGDSIRLITGSADQTAKLWDVRTGAPLFTFNFDSPTRSVDFAVGDKLAVITTDPFMGLPSAIHIKRIAIDPEDQSGESVLTLKGPQGRINRAVWGPLNRTIVSGGEDSVIRVWDSETGKLLNESDKDEGHKKTITSLAKAVDGSHLLSGSLDKSAKLWDSRTLKLVKTYVTERPVNAVAMSPLLDHIVLGGGQDASSVTTTDHRAGKFEAKFYDKILTEEIGGVKGHFGPINALAFNPDGRRKQTSHGQKRHSNNCGADDAGGCIAQCSSDDGSLAPRACIDHCMKECRSSGIGVAACMKYCPVHSPSDTSTKEHYCNLGCMLDQCAKFTGDEKRMTDCVFKCRKFHCKISAKIVE
ncbi:hypothetical protein SASPL_147943 [Salvia splendens]|uniref:Serine-threonine kinase receptor-associated protein n=1 Tax=Salvia splendens TaxID=180675 RepID=A0A8X8W9V3_SALSN|nr:hypothetical protein SASPL_147943 [Salvia splendens]